MPPLVSIISPHFNRASLLRKTLMSLVKQSLPEWEAIVVDDGSEPEEWSRAQQFADPRVRFLQRTDGIKGPSRCRNIGLKESVGRFVMFVDSDDIVAPWCLTERVALLEAKPAAAYLVFPVMLFQKTPGDMATLWNRLEGVNDLERFLWSDPPWHTSSPLWRRQAIEGLGGFDEEIMYGDDADLHMRALFAAIPYKKMEGNLPDVFIRRAAEDRITNSLSDRLLDSRLTRLERGTQLLKRCGTSEQQQVWQGQYFIEAEFLLFNLPNSVERQVSVVRSWRHHWTPPKARILKATGYMAVARLTKNHAYVILRLARRVAMLLLPESFFPRAGGDFESATVAPVILETVHSNWSKCEEL